MRAQIRLANLGRLTNQGEHFGQLHQAYAHELSAAQTDKVTQLMGVVRGIYDFEYGPALFRSLLIRPDGSTDVERMSAGISCFNILLRALDAAFDAHGGYAKRDEHEAAPAGQIGLILRADMYDLARSIRRNGFDPDRWDIAVDRVGSVLIPRLVG